MAVLALAIQSIKIRNEKSSGSVAVGSSYKAEISHLPEELSMLGGNTIYNLSVRVGLLR